MARRSFRRRFRRRGTVGRVRRSHKFTLVKGIKWAIAIAPNGFDLYDVWQQTHSPKTVGYRLTANTTGYDPGNGSFDITRPLKFTALPMVGAWIFGKLSSRVLR